MNRASVRERVGLGLDNVYEEGERGREFGMFELGGRCAEEQTGGMDILYYTVPIIHVQ
ncbi:predicted protein [Plenodomus lingam JN3]|uniref:Predicted protein n=1 Tax=Leptosphaeria maculans (strain JN3 / isolate v23.1.3 / race Av1-4-5-6-7-8) TaxID=985895 RepID=E4ZMB3_LEPMJ|nr:predicted protein [Plenodomus lingam JN3]CBX92462.1 predicted protein [Plenodomus lingam JN3]